MCNRAHQMAKIVKAVEFESILESLSKELGPVNFRATFSEDRAEFNLKDYLPTLTEAQQNAFDKPIGGREKFRLQAGDAKQFKDENTQLSLKPSSTIQQAAYWPDKEYLIVSFKSGHTYSYKGVDVRTVLRWEQASSAGSYFYYNIRMSFPYQKMG